MRGRLMLAVTAAMLWSGSAFAGLCWGDALMAKWSEGADRHAAGDFSGALNLLLPLAEGGFAPAQAVVGQIALAQASDSVQAVEAATWLKLAVRSEVRQVLRQSREAEDRLQPGDQMALDQLVRGWKAKPMDLCPDREQWSPGFSVRRNTALSSDALSRWWHDLALQHRESRPDAMAYMLSVSRVMFVEKGANASIARDGKGLILLVNAGLSAKPAAESIELLLPPLKEAVNDMAYSRLKQVPSETYRGRSLRGYPGADNSEFFALMKRGIDKAEALPPRLRQLAAQTVDIRNRPAFRYGQSDTRDVMLVHVADLERPNQSYSAFQSSPNRVSAADVVLGLVGNGRYFQHTREYFDLSRRGDPASQKRAAYLRARVEHTLPEFPLEEECQVKQDEYDTAKALDMDPKRLSFMSKTLLQRNCPGRRT